MVQSDFTAEISRHIWETKYRWRDNDIVHDQNIKDTWRRIATTLAAIEGDPQHWEQRFYDALKDFKFLPGGRIMAGAGTGHHVTLFNCFVMGLIEDSMDGIFDGLKQGAITMQQGGGVGYDFSTLRPRGTQAHTTGTVASGPVSFMRIWNAMCATVLSTGARRGAMMATLRCDHPDIEEFVTAKNKPGELNHFNLSVQVFDDFMEAVDEDRDWPLVFPAQDLGISHQGSENIIHKRWPGKSEPIPCHVTRRVPARRLWDTIMRSTYDFAEPGVLFVDRINEQNNLWYREQISATNPCGEIPLPPYGACDLGSINLTRFVQRPLTSNARIDLDAIKQIIPTVVRLMDNVIDVSQFPLPQQANTERSNRRLGIGVTGLADSLIMLGLSYNSPAGRETAAGIMETICHAAYDASIELAREKGPFPWFDAECYLQSRFIQSLPSRIVDKIKAHGIRNSHLLAIAPTGTISLLANNVSSGIEPVYDFDYTRRVLEIDGSYKQYNVTDYAAAVWKDKNGSAPFPPEFVGISDLDPDSHIAMQAALQPFVDNSISKTINIPESFSYEAFKEVYEIAYRHGLKGCTTFRPNVVTGSILEINKGSTASHCCSPEREAD
ncbi:MAG: adenosylcobalamin-dependent ribonucleoside-diphosphate reductase [Gammaproteobacteria bacterium]|jgi:ribonucleoside-diphosphate reductase alpha chain